MIRASLSATLAALLLAGAAASHAQTGDPRLVEHLYDPFEVVVIEGKPRVQATIAFAEDEAIENVAIGDSASWQVTPNKRANLLFVKPLSDKAMTNMTVVTDRRTYLFDLVAKPDADAIYVLRFTYPEEPEEGKSQLAAAPSELEMAAASDPYAVSDPARLNFRWKSSGAAKLLPAQAYDDGEATFLTWAIGTPIPAILIKDHEGTEGPVNFAVRGDTIVVDGVPREIILRSGDDVATMVNEGPIRSASERGEPTFAMNRETK
jgi:type IV secretion system protein VirB9